VGNTLKKDFERKATGSNGEIKASFDQSKGNSRTISHASMFGGLLGKNSGANRGQSARKLPRKPVAASERPISNFFKRTWEFMAERNPEPDKPAQITQTNMTMIKLLGPKRSPNAAASRKKAKADPDSPGPDFVPKENPKRDPKFMAAIGEAVKESHMRQKYEYIPPTRGIDANLLTNLFFTTQGFKEHKAYKGDKK
jgi:hypothetical protein